MTSEHRYEKIDLLESNDDGSDFDQDKAILHSRRTRSNSRLLSVHYVTLVAQIILLIANIAFFKHGVSFNSSSNHTIDGDHNVKVPFSPANDKVQYSIQQTDSYSMQTSPFIGEPRLELDQAWSDLLRSTNIRISEDEMRQMNKTSVKLKDGSGYLGYLEVHHMLHCLKRFKQFRHLEHYSAIDPKTFDIPHWDHCIEVVRQGIMCNADLMIDTLRWTQNGTWLQGVNHWPRKCANWDSIQAFTDSRKVEVDHYDPLLNVVPSDNEWTMGPN